MGSASRPTPPRGRTSPRSTIRSISGSGSKPAGATDLRLRRLLRGSRATPLATTSVAGAYADLLTVTTSPTIAIAQYQFTARERLLVTAGWNTKWSASTYAWAVANNCLLYWTYFLNAHGCFWPPSSLPSSPSLGDIAVPRPDCEAAVLALIALLLFARTRQAVDVVLDPVQSFYKRFAKMRPPPQLAPKERVFSWPGAVTSLVGDMSGTFQLLHPDDPLGDDGLGEPPRGDRCRPHRGLLPERL